MRSLAVLPLFLSLAPAQVEAIKGRPMNAEPLVRCELRGPAVLASRVRPTNFGSLLASAKGEALWRDGVGELDRQWRLLDGGTDATFLVARQRVLDYGGRVRLLVWADAAHAQPGAPLPSFAAFLDADGKTDLAALGQDLLRWIGNASGGKVAPGELAGVALQVARADAGVFGLGVLPDGRLGVAGGKDVEAAGQALQRALASLPPGQPESSAPLLGVQLDLAQVVSAAVQRDRSVEHLGFESLQKLELALQARGPRLQGDVSLTFFGERGIFAALFPEHAGIPAMFGLVPKGSLASKAGRLDVTALWDATIRGVASWMGDPVDKMETQVNDYLGIDVRKDLLPHLTDELLLFWQARERRAETDPMTDLSVGAVMRLRDGKAFAAAWKILLEKVGFLVEEVDGVLQSNESWMTDWFRFAVRGDLLAVTLGDRDGKLMDAFLATKPGPDALPAEVVELQRASPPGCNSAGVLDVHIALRDHLGVLFSFLDEMLPPLPPWPETATKTLLAALAPLLKEHALDRVVTFSGTEKGRWVFRVFW